MCLYQKINTNETKNKIIVVYSYSIGVKLRKEFAEFSIGFVP